MKSDPDAGSLDDAAVAGMHKIGSEAPAGRVKPFVLLIAIPLLVLGIASLAAIVIVRVGADLRLGLDPFAPQSVRLPLREIAFRGIAVDILRQVLIVALVVGVARWQDGAAWRRRLALTRPAEPRAPIRHAWVLWLLLLIWPAIHIAWVTASAEALRVSFGPGVRLSPLLTPVLVASWIAYVALLAPLAEELLLRGEAFARASAFLPPAGAIAATALLFCLLHVSEMGLARPITLLPLAVTLGWLRWRTGRLWPCILLHGWSNVALLAYLLQPAAD